MLSGPQAALVLVVAAVGCATSAPGSRMGNAPATSPTASAATTASGSAAAPAAVRAEIARALAHGADAWNRGDLDAFMADYAPDTTTTYVGRRGLVRGRAAIRATYAPRFAPGVQRGTLRFEDLEVDSLAPDAAFAIATYVLTVGDSTIARGPTSLLFRRLGGRWLITRDHSS